MHAPPDSHSIPVRLIILVLAVLTTLSCAGDPEVAKKEFIERGDQFATKRAFKEAIIEYSRALQKDPLYSLAHERLGEVYLEQGDKMNAWQSYQRAADLSPADIDLQIKAAGVLLLTQRFSDAQRIAERVLESQPNNVDALVLRANALAGLENLDTAILQVQGAISLASDHGELYSNLASLQATSGQLEEAESTFRRAVEVEPNSARSYLPLGNFYWATERPREAEKAFLKAVQLEPENLLAHRALATFYLGAGVPPRAETSLKFVAEHAPESEHRLALADYYLVIGRRAEGVALLEKLSQAPDSSAAARTRLAALAHAEGRRDEAKRALDSVLERFPNNSPAILLKARFALHDGRRAEALTLATQASRTGPGNIQALSMMGQLFLEDGDYFQASQAYKAVLRLNPLATHAQVELARILYLEGGVDDSKMLLKRAIRSRTGDENTRLAIVRALLERQDFAGASAQLNELLKQYPDTPVVHSLIGALNFLKRDYAEARKWYERALAGNPALLDALSGLVGLDLTAKRPADAVARVLERVEQSPRNGPLLVLLARTYGAVRDVKNAEEALRRAIDVDPDGFQAYGMLGQLLYEQGRLEEGRREFEKVVELRPRAVPAHTMIGVILRREGKTDEAVAQYLKVLELDREAAVAANNLAWIYAERGQNLDEALMYARIAKRKLPDVATVSDTLGWTYYRSGQSDSLMLALPFLREAADKEPNNPLFRYHFGAVLARLGKKDDARRELEAAVRLAPDFHGAAESRRILATLQ